MTNEELKRANYLKDEIRKLECFIISAQNVWTGKIIKRTSKFIFRSNAYGAFTEAEYEMDYETKDKVLNFLRERLESLKSELESM